jgi:hypothetical protein
MGLALTVGILADLMDTDGFAYFEKQFGHAARRKLTSSMRAQGTSAREIQIELQNSLAQPSAASVTPQITDFDPAMVSTG